MSFSYNPYEHIEIVRDPAIAEKKPDDSDYVVYCHSCGNSRMRLPIGASISFAFEVMADHIQKSHARSREDFESWSNY